MSKILRNSAKCAHCGYELVSEFRHDFRTHVCEQAGKIAREYDHDKKEYVPAFPSFSVDGGNAYIRRLFNRKEDYVETSVEEEDTECPECFVTGFHKMGCSKR